MAASVQYLVISAVPVVVEDGGTAISYSPGQTFFASPRNASVVRLLEVRQIIPATGPTPAPQPAPGPVVPSGWTDDGGLVHLTTTSDTVSIGVVGMFGSEKVRIVGDTRIEGKLTVTGLIDPTGLYLDEQVADQPAVANKGVFYTKDVLGVTQAFYRSSSGGITQLTGIAPSGTNLDDAYHFGGFGTGRTILVDEGAVRLNKSVVDATSALEINVIAGTGAALSILGSTSGAVGFKAPAVAGSATFTLPAGDGTVGQVLTTDGATILGWSTIASGGNLDAAYHFGAPGTGRTITVDEGAVRLNKAIVDATNAFEVNVTGGTGLAALFSGDVHVTGKLTVDGLIDPTALLLSGPAKKFGATDAGPIFLSPFTDAVTGVQVRKADGTTVFANFDTTNGRLGLNTVAPAGVLTIDKSAVDAVDALVVNVTGGTGQAASFSGAAVAMNGGFTAPGAGGVTTQAWGPGITGAGTGVLAAGINIATNGTTNIQAFGRNITLAVGADNSTVLGSNLAIPLFGSCILVGDNINVQDTTVGVGINLLSDSPENTLVGQSISNTGGAAYQNVLVGGRILGGPGAYAVGIGYMTEAFADRAIALGHSAVTFTRDRITRVKTAIPNALVVGHLGYEVRNTWFGAGVQAPATSGRFGQAAPTARVRGTSGQLFTAITSPENFAFSVTAPTAVSTNVLGGGLTPGDTYLLAVGYNCKELLGETLLSSPYAVTVLPGDNAILVSNLNAGAIDVQTGVDPQIEQVIVYMETAPGSGNLKQNGTNTDGSNITLTFPNLFSVDGYVGYPMGGEVDDGFGHVTTPDASASITTNTTASSGAGWLLALAGGESDDDAQPGGDLNFEVNKTLANGGGAHTLTLAGRFRADDGYFAVGAAAPTSRLHCQGTSGFTGLELATTTTLDNTTATDTTYIVADANAATFSINLPPIADCVNRRYKIIRVDSVFVMANTVDIIPFGAETINGAGFFSILAQYDSFEFWNDGTAWYIF